MTGDVWAIKFNDRIFTIGEVVSVYVEEKGVRKYTAAQIQAFQQYPHTTYVGLVGGTWVPIDQVR